VTFDLAFQFAGLILAVAVFVSFGYKILFSIGLSDTPSDKARHRKQRYLFSAGLLVFLVTPFFTMPFAFRLNLDIWSTILVALSLPGLGGALVVWAVALYSFERYCGDKQQARH
jgi:hypothetical protein